MDKVRLFYQQKADWYSAQLKIVSVRLRRFAWYRFLAFLMIPAPFFVFGFNDPVSYSVAFFALVLLLYLVKKNIQAEKRKKEIFLFKKLAEDELLALEHKYSHFNNGAGYIDPDHFYAFDLDIFGEGSMFQFINRTVTVDGENLLARSFIHPEMDLNVIRKRQEAVRELSQNPDWLLQFRVSGLMSDESKELNQEIRAWSELDMPLKNAKTLKYLLWSVPLITVAAAIPAILGITDLLLYAMVLFQWILLVIYRKQVAKSFSQFGRKSALLEKYRALLSLIGSAHFKTERFVELQRSVIEPIPAERIFSELNVWTDRFEYRQNIIVAFLLNSVTLWDVRCMYHLWRWHKNYHHNIAEWLDAIAAVDELVSIAVFAHNNTSNIFPEISADEFAFAAKQLGHPLLPAGKRVCNDFSVTDNLKTIIVTGANMAGKSTFLRTVGINLVLACMGAPVCAERMIFTPVQLYTNMRTTDSLQKEESYFFAELKRLKRMLDILESGTPVFVILDEMLKGTNSVDKLNGSKELIKKLLSLPSVALIATHDLKLSEMQDEFPDRVTNLCFEIKLENNEMIFDYKLSPGVTQTMNATFLMKKMGII